MLAADVSGGVTGTAQSNAPGEPSGHRIYRDPQAAGVLQTMPFPQRGAPCAPELRFQTLEVFTRQNAFRCPLFTVFFDCFSVEDLQFCVGKNLGSKCSSSSTRAGSGAWQLVTSQPSAVCEGFAGATCRAIPW